MTTSDEELVDATQLVQMAGSLLQAHQLAERQDRMIQLLIIERDEARAELAALKATLN